MPEWVVGLDVGSTSVRALVADLDGRSHGYAERRLACERPAPGTVEQDPELVWQTTRAVAAEAIRAAGRPASDLAALGLATQRSSVVVWERTTGAPLAPMVLWNDLGGEARARELRDAGFLAPALAAVAKLEATLDRVPDGRARAAAGEICWGTLDSYLTYRLTGGARHVTDLTNAWPTCYLDLATRRDWNRRLIEHQGLSPRMFPALCETLGAHGTTVPEALGAGLPIAAIVADQQSGMLAHGIAQADRAGAWKATYGTSATLMACTGDAPVLSPGLHPLIQLAAGGGLVFALEGMVNSAGAFFDWLVGDMGWFASHDELTDRASQVSHAAGVAVRPALQGLGAPHHDARARAAVVGLSGATTRAELARAAFEAVAFRIREIADRVAGSPGLEVPESLPVDGGVVSNDVFLQIQADLLGRPVERHAQPQATALGACIGAALGRGLLKPSDLAAFARSDRCFEPAIPSAEADERLAAWRQAIALPEPARG